MGKSLPPPQHTSVPTLEASSSCCSFISPTKHGSSFFIFKDGFCASQPTTHHAPAVGVGGGGTSRKVLPGPVWGGWSSQSLPPQPWTLHSCPQSLHLAPSHIRGQQVTVSEEAGGSWAYSFMEVVPSCCSLLLEPAQASVKTYSSGVFTTCILFLFYIGEENVFFDTHKTIQSFRKNAPPTVLSRLRGR